MRSLLFVLSTPSNHIPTIHIPTYLPEQNDEPLATLKCRHSDRSTPVPGANTSHVLIHRPSAVYTFSINVAQHNSSPPHTSSTLATYHLISSTIHALSSTTPPQEMRHVTATAPSQCADFHLIHSTMK